MPTLMKCSIMLHFIWDFTVCQSTGLGVTSIQMVKGYCYGVPTSSGNHGNPAKSLKKSSMHEKIMDFEKKLNNHGKIVEFCEII